MFQIRLLRSIQSFFEADEFVSVIFFQNFNCIGVNENVQAK